MSGGSEKLRKIVHRVRHRRRPQQGAPAALADGGARPVLGGRGPVLLAVAILSLAGAGCGDATMVSGRPSAVPRSAPGDGAAAAASEVCVTGRATQEGVECQAFRADDGRLYTLLGDLDSLAGDRDLCVCGRPVEMSTCMQGTTITVSRIGPPDSCP